jgi:hypothetical protein
MGYCFCLAIHLFFGVQRRMCATQINAPPYPPSHTPSSSNDFMYIDAYTRFFIKINQRL